MSNHILVFYDREGNERFFLRRKATTPDIQCYLLCFALWAKAENSMGKTQVGAAFLTIMKHHWSVVGTATARRDEVSRPDEEINRASENFHAA